MSEYLKQENKSLSNHI